MTFDKKFNTDLQAIIKLIDEGNINNENGALDKFKAHVKEVATIGRFSLENWNYEWRDNVYKFGTKFSNLNPIDFLNILTEAKNELNKDKQEVLDFYYSEIDFNSLPQESCTTRLENLISKYPYNPEFRHTLGHFYKRKAEFLKAIEQYKFALKKDENNAYFEIPGTSIDGGTLGGLLNFRRDALDVAQNALNRSAIGFAQSMNAQHALGVDVNGNAVAGKVSSQQEFFNIKSFAADLRIPRNSENNGTLTLKASVMNYIPGTTNLTGYSQMTNNDYKILCTDDTAPGKFSIVRQPDNTLVSPTDLNGVSLGTSITPTQLANGIVIDGVKDEVSDPTAAANTAGTPAATGAGVPAKAAAAATAAMTSVLAEMPSPSTPAAIAAAEKAGYAAASAMGHAMTAAQMLATSTAVSGSIAGERAANVVAATAVGAVVTSDSFMLQPTRGAIGQMLVNVTQPSEVATASNIIAKSAATNTGGAAISAAWQRPVKPSNMIVMDTSVPGTSGIGLEYQTPALPGNPTGWKVVSVLPPAVAADYRVVINDDTAGGFKIITDPGLENTGIEFKVDGTPKIGDDFTIRPKTTAEFGVSDSFNMLQMAAIQTQSTMEGSGGGKPTTSFVGSYSRMVSMVANKTAEAEAAGSAATASLKEATLTRESISGVNLDEEAANLLRFQQAYQASSKCIEIANTLFDSILNAVN